MRLRIAHRMIQTHETPARAVTQVLRLTPRNHEGQRVGRWRIDVDADCALRAMDDAFGNITHMFTATGRIERLTASADGDVETFDCAGVARGMIEPFPPELYLRATSHTQPDEGGRALAAKIVASETDRLARLHRLMDEIARVMSYEQETGAGEGAAAMALAAGRGDSRDFAHVFIVCARLMDIPARYVSGYFLSEDALDRGSVHAWAEAYVDKLGWVGFDVVHRICPREGHVGVARGLDYLGAAPARRSSFGGGRETFSVELDITRL